MRVCTCYSSHNRRPSHCPVQVRRATQKPTPICIKTPHAIAPMFSHGSATAVVSIIIYIPQASTIASIPTCTWSLRSSRLSRLNACKRFSICYWAHSNRHKCATAWVQKQNYYFIFNKPNKLLQKTNKSLAVLLCWAELLHVRGGFWGADGDWLDKIG